MSRLAHHGPFIEHHVEQNTPEWHMVRARLPTASSAALIATPATRATDGAGARGYADLLGLQAHYGMATEDTGSSFHARQGHERESSARFAYAAMIGLPVREAGFCTDARAIWGCSPDGFVLPRGTNVATAVANQVAPLWAPEFKCLGDTKFSKIMRAWFELREVLGERWARARLDKPDLGDPELGAMITEWLARKDEKTFQEYLPQGHFNMLTLGTPRCDLTFWHPCDPDNPIVIPLMRDAGWIDSLRKGSVIVHRRRLEFQRLMKGRRNERGRPLGSDELPLMTFESLGKEGPRFEAAAYGGRPNFDRSPEEIGKARTAVQDHADMMARRFGESLADA